jgi:membrane-associated phospholipid phosphatase
MTGHAYTAAIPRGRTPAAVARSGTREALGIAALCLFGLALVWVVAELVPAAQVRDTATLRDFTLLDHSHTGATATWLIHLLDPGLFIIWGLALVLVALARDRPRVALAVAVVIGLAPLASDRLKPLLAHPHARSGVVHIGPASWPSGHSTAALALALCAALVAPRRVRPLVVVLGVAFAAAVGCALLIHAWHMPSDVVGGYLMAGLWTALAVTALRAAERRWPSSPARTAAGSGARP